MVKKPVPKLKMSLVYNTVDNDGKPKIRKKMTMIQESFIFEQSSGWIKQIVTILNELNDKDTIQVNFNVAEPTDILSVKWNIQELLKICDKRLRSLAHLPVIVEDFQLYKRGIHYKY